VKSGQHRIWRAAVVFIIAAWGVGCVPRDTLEKMQDQLNYLESASRRDLRKTDRMDSVLTENTNANRELRADVYVALDELRQELTAIKENIADLGAKIDRRGTEHAVLIYPDQTGTDTTGAAAPGSTSTPGAEMLAVNCGELYEQAFKDLRYGNYELAIEGFEEFLRTCASSPDVPRALYWLGECHYSNEDYAVAIDVFKRLIDDFPSIDRVPSALFKLGRCHEQSDQPRHAKTYYERLIKEYPRAIESRPAESRLNALKLEGGG